MPPIAYILQRIAARLRSAVSGASFGARENISSLARKPIEGSKRVTDEDRELVHGTHYIYSEVDGKLISKKEVAFTPEQVLSEPMVDWNGRTRAIFYPQTRLDQQMVNYHYGTNLFMPDLSYYRNSVEKNDRIIGEKISAPWQRKNPQDKTSPADPTYPLFIDVHASPDQFSVVVELAPGKLGLVGIDHKNFGKVVAANQNLQAANRSGRVHKLVFAACSPAGNSPELPLQFREQISRAFGDKFDIFMSPHDVNLGTLHGDTVTYIDVDDSESSSLHIEESWLHLPAKIDESTKPKYID